MKIPFFKEEEEHFTMNLGNKTPKKPSEKPSPDPDDIIKDSLRVCYKPYSRYKNFVEQITKEGWNYVGDIQSYALTHRDMNMVMTFLLERGMYGTFLEVMCPAPNYMLTVCGFDDAGIDPIDFYSHSNLYKIPHYFSMLCTDKNGKELSPATIIDIVKVKTNAEAKIICSEPYGDLSQNTNTNKCADRRYRRKEERYYFYNSIKLRDYERLSFRTNSPDIDIETTNLFMQADLFMKEI